MLVQPVVAEVKKVKKEEISKTAVIYEVKPLEAGQDMKAMEAAIREWVTSLRTPVAPSIPN
jgi:hypothetical protein